MIEINNRTRAKIDVFLVKSVVEFFLKCNRIKNKEVSVAFISDDEIKKINKRYRKINRQTDVLSFGGEGNFLGEIVIGYSQIKRQAIKSKKKINDELVFILVHGLLHLIGYDDETEEGRLRMVKLGENFISKFKKK